MQDNKFESALVVNKGVEQPPVVNPYIGNFYKKNKNLTLSEDDYLKGILEGDITILSQAITLVESSRPDHRALAQNLISECLPHAVKSMRIGITGVPGAGKSTFIEAFGGLITAMGHKLAVLAIDPSSERSKGSILGDKTRMESLSVDPRVFIRPSPTGGSLGGVARKTRETIVLCEAAGFNHIFIETVGVGQSETAVHSMTDFFLLLMLAGAGDELQGIKRGIMEMADLIAINKADGNNLEKAQLAKIQYKNALHLFPKKDSDWVPGVLTCSAAEKNGIDSVWSEIEKYRKLTNENGWFATKRNEQAIYWMHETIQEHLKRNFYGNQEIKPMIEELEQKVLGQSVSSFAAAGILL